MDEFERGLSVALHATPPPPVEIDAAEITRGAGPRMARAVVAPLVSVIVVAAIAVTVVLIVHQPGTRKPAAGPGIHVIVSENPDDLYRGWILSDLQGLDGAAHTQPDPAMTIRFDPSGYVFAGQCMTAHVVVHRGSFTFEQDWITTTPTSCAADTGNFTQYQFVFGILSRTPSWQVRDGALEITRNGGRVVFEPNDGLTWARDCVPPTFGPMTHDFDGLTIEAARQRASQEGMQMDFLAADGRCDIGSIGRIAGNTYVHAAIQDGRVVFARIS